MSAVPTRGGVPIEVVVLNGASSTGKTTLAVALQDELEESWLVFGIDTLIGALPLALLDIPLEATIDARPREHRVRTGGLRFGANGEVAVGGEFRRLEAGWLSGLAKIAASGVRLILDEVFLDGIHSQDRIRRALIGRRVLWVGVTCDGEVATQRERDRGDRVVGASETVPSRPSRCRLRRPGGHHDSKLTRHRARDRRPRPLGDGVTSLERAEYFDPSNVLSSGLR